MVSLTSAWFSHHVSQLSFLSFRFLPPRAGLFCLDGVGLGTLLCYPGFNPHGSPNMYHEVGLEGLVTWGRISGSGNSHAAVFVWIKPHSTPQQSLFVVADCVMIFSAYQ